MMTKSKLKAILTVAYIVLCISLFSCDSHFKGARYNVMSFSNYDIVLIDNCEYFQYRSANGYLSITHKGNCNSCRSYLKR